MTDETLKRDRSRRSDGSQPVGLARHGRLPRSRVWKTVLAVVASGLAVVLVATGAVVGIALAQLSNELDLVDINETEVPVPEVGAYEGGFNILVVGSDAFYDRDSVLNDVNILVHVSADHTNATVVSFPRDMVVPFPPCTNPETGKTSSAMAGRPINEALYYGGLGCVVEVVKNFTGLEIQYAGMIGFEGVAAMASAVGGVDVCTTARIDDDATGIHLDPGTHHLEGWDVLMFLRTRKGVGNGSDLTRISSQQAVLSSLLRRLKSEDTLTDATKLIGLTKAATENMQLSRELTQPATILAMAKALNNIPMDRITFVQYPGSTGGTGIYEGKVQPIQGQGSQLIDAIKADQPVGVEKVGDGVGSEADPNATTAPEPSASPDPSGSPTPAPELGEKVVIPGIHGQSAADQTCTVGRG